MSQVDSTVRHTVKTAILKVPETAIELGNLEVL
jgi:hypothetical protein